MEIGASIHRPGEVFTPAYLDHAVREVLGEIRNLSRQLSCGRVTRNMQRKF